MGRTEDKAVEDMSLEELEAMEDEEDERVLLQYRYQTDVVIVIGRRWGNPLCLLLTWQI